MENGLLKVLCDDGTSYSAEMVLCAIGRPAKFSSLKLENVGVLVEKNAIKVDEFSNTNVKNIYAIGDVTNKVNLTPVAIREGRILSERLFNN